MKKILITGANGFVGKALCQQLEARHIDFRGTTRAQTSADGRYVSAGELHGNTDWQAALDGCDAVVHLANRAHVMHETAANPLREFRRINVEGTINLARQAMAIGVRRFVFVSSIKVNGEITRTAPFKATDTPAPTDPYGVSKLEAERALQSLCAGSTMELVIVRPPLVYGPGVKANFLRLIQAVDRGIPLPFGAIDNRRSMIALGNLCDMLIRCVEHPRAAGKIFLVSDGVDLSTADLVRMIAAALGRKPHLVAVPAGLLRLAAALLGKSASADRVLGSLQVDMHDTRQTIDWTPPETPLEAIKQTVSSIYHAP